MRSVGAAAAIELWAILVVARVANAMVDMFARRVLESCTCRDGPELLAVKNN